MNQIQAITLIQADIPVFIWGDPGCGKTQWARALATAAGFHNGAHVNLETGKVVSWHFHTETLAQCDASDIGGIPRDNGAYIIRKPLKWLHDLCVEPGLLFLDEAPLAPRMNLAASLRLICEREAGDATLHPESRVMAAGNSSAFTGVDLMPQVANRFAHIEFEELMPLAQWVQGMIAGFPPPQVARLPETWQAHIPTHRALVASYVSKMPTEAFRVPKDGSGLGRAWPSRRTWDLAARASAACGAAGVDDALPIGSLVGDGPALSYIGWRERQDLPDPEEVLANAATWVLPEEDDRLFVILSACAAAAVAKPDPKKWGQAWVVVGRAARGKKVDVAVLAARVLVAQAPPGSKTPKVAEELIPLLRAAGGG